MSDLNLYWFSLVLLSIKVAQNSFQHFPRRRFWWFIITTRYQLMLQSTKTAESLVNTLVLFSWLNGLPSLGMCWKLFWATFRRDIGKHSRHCLTYFQTPSLLSSRCLEMWSNTVFRIWGNISNTRDSVSSGYPNTEKRVENTMRSGVFWRN